MTETTAPPGPASAPALLYRDPDAGMLAGVCTGLARYTGTDPVLWRIVLVVLALFGGTGIALYLLGWLLIPKVGEPLSTAERWLHRERRMTPAAVAVIAVVALVLFAGMDDGHGLAAVAILAVVGYLVYRERQGRPVVPAYQPAADEPAAWTPPPGAVWTPPPPVARPPGSRLGAVTLSLAVLVTGVLVLARTYGADGLTPSRIVAAALVVVAGGLVVGTWFGRARWLAAIALLLCVALGATAAVDSTDGAFRGGFGDRTWLVRPTEPTQSFRLGAGEATLDLRALEPQGRHLNVDAHVAVGHLIVLVPDGVPIRLHAKVRVGEINEFGDDLANGDSVERTRSYGPVGDPRVEVDATMGAGQVEVRHG